MMAAAVAYPQLTPAARTRADALLRLNPSYDQWVAGVPAPQRAAIAFLRAATWADAIKHAPDYRNDAEQPQGPQASRNLGYRDYLQHRYWHYIDVPFSPDHTPLRAPRRPNVGTQIAAFRRVIASSSASAALQSYDLVWLLHLVADAHQPLHAAERFTQAQPAGDEGGNLVALCARPCRRELHGFWDAVLGAGRDPGRARRAAAQLPPSDARLAAISDESRWIEESFQLAQRSAYAAPIGAGMGPFTLTPGYRQDARQIARARIALAGTRLARLLNQAFK